MENRIHIEISDENNQIIMEAIATLEATLGPVLKTISTDERRNLPKMGTSNTSFVGKVLEYSKSDDQFNPPYMDPQELEVDFTSVQQLLTYLRPLRQLLERLEDSTILAGSEAYVAALSYYNSVKMADRMDIPEAKTILTDLRQRFDSQGNSSPRETEE